MVLEDRPSPLGVGSRHREEGLVVVADQRVEEETQGDLVRRSARGKDFTKGLARVPLARMGGYGTTEGTFSGVMGETRISKVARYDKNFTPAKRFESDVDTLALYHFDEGQGEVLKDSSGNNHHGKIVGAKWVSGTAGGNQP